jgi:hypothetical protein
MVTPVVVGSGDQRRFFWNLSANVGTKSPNKADDVQLVQLGYVCASYDTFYSAALRATFAAVIPGAPYSGQENDPLTRAIRAHEQQRGGAQDGHVSVLTSLTNASYDGGAHTFLIVSLNFQLRTQMPGNFPRLDKHPKCPAQLRAAVFSACKPE